MQLTTLQGVGGWEGSVLKIAEEFKQMADKIKEKKKGKE